MRKLPAQVFLDMIEIECFEVTVMGLMKVNQAGQDIAEGQLMLTPAFFLTTDDQMGFPFRRK